MTDCPSDSDLSGFLDESLPVERLAVLSAHVDGCPNCQDRLDRLTNDTDSAVARYKELSSIIDSVPGTVPSTPDAGTLILGVDGPAGTQRSSSPGAPRLVGLPVVPGFDVAAEIGRGGMGVVFRARHRRLNRLCALKMILAGGAADTVTVQRFLFEAEILARVQHPQVVQVFEVDTYQGPSGVPIPYLAMELLEGGSLGARIREGPMPAKVAAELIEGLARAVHAAHMQGVIHRDLKPGNILFPVQGTKGPESDTGEKPPSSGSTPTSDSMRYAPKVTDFGLAKFIETGADMTQTGQVVGTPHYMAPEQAEGGKQIGPPADVYALGAILFECLAGRRPFEGSDPMNVLMKVVHDQPPNVLSLRPDVPRDLAAVVARCLNKEPRRRYVSAAEFADDLRRFLENRPTVARPLRRRERLWLWTKRNPAVAALTAALTGVMAVAFLLITLLWLKAEETAEQQREARDDADRAARIAIRNEHEAQTQRGLAERREVLLEFGRAVDTCEEGRVEKGLEYFLHALELAERTDQKELAHVIRLNLAAWPAEVLPRRQAYTHTYQPRQAVFLPDGERMVAAGREGEVHLWNLATGKKEVTYKSAGLIENPFIDIVYGLSHWTVAVSKDGKTIAAGSSDGHITLWDTNSRDRRARFLAIDTRRDVWMLEFAEDGTLWANDGHDGLKRWDLTAPGGPTATQFSPPAGSPGGEVQALALSKDGKRVYSGDRDGIIREWDGQTGEHLRAIWQINDWVADVAVSADGTRLAATGPEGYAYVFALNANRPPVVIDLDAAYGNGIAFAPKRPFVLTSDSDGNVRVWHQDTGQPIGFPYRFSGEVTKVRFKKDSDEFAVPAGDTVYVTRVPDPPVDVLTAGFGSRVRGLDFSSDGKRLAATDDKNLQVFEPLTGKRIQWLDYRAIRNGKWVHVTNAPLTMRYDPDPARSRVLRGIRGSFDQIAVPDGRAGVKVTSGLHRVRQIEFCPSKQHVFLIDDTKLARFDADSLKQTWIGKPTQDIPAGVELLAIAARPDGKELMVSVAKRVLFLDPDTMKLIREWPTRDEVLDAKYTPDGKRLLIGRRDNLAQLLDAATGVEVVRSMPHTSAVTGVAVSPSGKVLLTGSRDWTARFWDADTGLPLGPPMHHLGPVTYVRYSPDGEHIATGTGRGHVMIWDIPPPATNKTLDELRVEMQKLGG